MVHFPLWGANAALEAIIGGILGYAYWYSDQNLAVPIVIHSLYDYTTMLITWYFAKTELNDAIFREIKREVLQMKSMTRKEIDDLATRVFNVLDLNKDGNINSQEFEAALRLYG